MNFLCQQLEPVILFKSYLFTAVMYIIITKLIEHILHVTVYVLYRSMI